MGFCFVGSVGIVAQWFTKRRSFANALAAAGSGFGGLTYSLATDAMIRNLGLAWAFRILAVIVFMVNGICSLVIRDRNKAVGEVYVAFHKELFRKLEFYLFLSWGFFSMMAYTIAVFSISDFGSVVGFDIKQGALLASLFNRGCSPRLLTCNRLLTVLLVSQGLGRPMIGLVSDSFGRINIAAIGTLISAFAALFLWIFAGKAFAGAVVYSLFGAFAGIIWATVAPLGVEVIGLQLLPSGEPSPSGFELEKADKTDSV